MGEREAIASLILRIEDAKGADREIDVEIVAHLNKATVRPYPPTDDFGPRDRWQFWSRDGEHFLGSESKYPVPAYTASVDAALALVERCLPGWSFQITHHPARPNELATIYVTLYRLDYDDPCHRCQARHEAAAEGRPSTLALTILSALLRALQDKP